MNKEELQLGTCRGMVALVYHQIEAYKEKGKIYKYYDLEWDPIYAIFSNKYIKDIRNINNNKIHTYCFIGDIDSCKDKRKWVIEFAKKYFTKDSIFINTYKPDDWIELGEWDYTLKINSFCPKKEKYPCSKYNQYRIIQKNSFYFTKMRQSKYILCPAGDQPWSFRFYETLMCESIPILISEHNSYRTEEESKIPYKYLIYNENWLLPNEYDISIINKNNILFQKYHML